MKKVLSNELNQKEYNELLDLQKKHRLTERELEGFLEFYKLKRPKSKILNLEETNES